MGQNKSASTDKERSPLKKLKVLSQKTKLSDSDIRAAEELNEALGGMYSHLILAMQTRLEQEKNGKSSNNLGQNNRMKSVDALLKKQDEYFKDKKVEKTYETLKSIGSGNVPSDEELCDMAESLTDNHHRKFRENAIQALCEEAVNIYNRALHQKRTLTKDELAKLKQIDSHLMKHKEAEYQSRSLIEKTGELTGEDLKKKVKEKRVEITSDSKHLSEQLEKEAALHKKANDTLEKLCNEIDAKSNGKLTSKQAETIKTHAETRYNTNLYKSSDGALTSFMNQAQTQYVDPSRAFSPDSTPGQGATRNKGRV